MSSAQMPPTNRGCRVGARIWETVRSEKSWKWRIGVIYSVIVALRLQKCRLDKVQYWLREFLDCVEKRIEYVHFQRLSGTHTFRSLNRRDDFGHSGNACASSYVPRAQLIDAH